MTPQNPALPPPPEPDIVDGFTYSMRTIMNVTNYRSSALAQMEFLRRAQGYTARWYTAPNTIDEPQSQYSQVKYQLNITPGSYIWGISTWFPNVAFGELVHIMVTDACSELPLFSDYVRGDLLLPDLGRGANGPMLLPQPRLISEPGSVNVEVYLGKSSSEDGLDSIQVVFFTAEPCSKLLAPSLRAQQEY